MEAPIALSANFRFLDGGRNSKCFTDGKAVVKFAPAGQTAEEAERKLRLLQGEHDLFAEHLGEYVLDTSFDAVNQNGWAIRIEQPFVTGTPFRRTLGNLTPASIDFLRRSLDLYHKVGTMPDLIPDIMPDPTLGVYLTGKFRYRSNTNVFVAENSPILVDTVLAWPFRMRYVKPVVTALVAGKIKSLVSGR